MVGDRVVGKHSFCFNKHEHGAESLELKTTFINNGDPGSVYLSQILVLQGCYNSASFDLTIQITPDILRELANELEKELIKARIEAGG